MLKINFVTLARNIVKLKFFLKERNVAQLGLARQSGGLEVVGSNPIIPTKMYYLYYSF